MIFCGATSVSLAFQVGEYILITLFQVPAKPNYCLVLYYAADRPVKQSSLLAKFADGSDMFRDARFKLIPSIVEVWNAQSIKILQNFSGLCQFFPWWHWAADVFKGYRGIGWSSVQLEQKLAYWGKL